mgnify:CR=1 FL=1
MTVSLQECRLLCNFSVVIISFTRVVAYPSGFSFDGVHYEMILTAWRIVNGNLEPWSLQPK